MKNLRYIILAIGILSGTGHLAAQSEQLTKLWQQAEQQYTAQQYEEAAESYRQLMSYGSSAALYYNYANSLFKSGETGQAILNYERALRLDPSNDNIRFNLEYANSRKTDQIEEIEPFFLQQWSRGIERMMSPNAWAYTGTVCFTITLILVLVYLFCKTTWLRKTAFFTAVATLVLTITSVGYTFSSKANAMRHDEAIVLAGSVSVKSSPDESGTEVFVIHEGTKVKIVSVLGGWREVKIADGNLGWIPAENIEVI